MENVSPWQCVWGWHSRAPAVAPAGWHPGAGGSCTTESCQWVPGHPTDHGAEQRCAPAQGELQRPPPAAGSSCSRALPFTAHLSHQAHAGSSKHRFASARGSREDEPRRLPQTCSLPPCQACHSFAPFIREMLLHLPAAPQRTAGPDKQRTVSAQPPCSSPREQSQLLAPRRLLQAQAATHTSPEMWARSAL